MLKIHKGRGRPGTRTVASGPRVQGPEGVRIAQHVRIIERSPRPWYPAQPGEPAEILHPLLPDLDTYDLDLSVIFGTYNRKALLQKSIASIRAASKNYAYEIIVADGGSTDGSREWLREQDDVVLIEGDLSGAVPAFNSCFRRVRGRYILTLNDDAQLLPTTIDVALPLFNSPLVGQIACKFREGGKLKLQHVHNLVYVNFGFIRTNLARAIARICGGLWATCYQTYGGDTELSCWVRRLGYRIAESRAEVIHAEYDDDLRTKNKRTDRRRTQFFHRWPSPQMLQLGGPPPRVSPAEAIALKRIEIGETPQQRWARLPHADPELGELPPRAAPRPERVLHMHLWTDEDPQASLASSMKLLGSKGHVRIDWTKIADPTQRGRELVQAASALQPTLIFMQLQGGNVPVDAVQILRKRAKDPNLVIVSWSGDVGPGQGPWPNMRDRWAYEMSPNVDLMLFTGTGQVKLHRQRGMKNAAYLQIGYDVDRYYPGPRQRRRHDVVFLGQDYSKSFETIPRNDVQLRRDVVGAFRNSGLDFGLYGPNWGRRGSPTRVLHQTGAGDAYRHSALALSVSVTSQLGRYSSDRLIRSMASGCPTLVKRFEDMEGWGLQHERNCLIWDHPKEAVELARAYLEKPAELASIGRAGAELMASHHTWEHRLTELSAILLTLRGQPWTT